MRKILGLAAGAGMLLAVAVPALAGWGYQRPSRDQGTEIKVENEGTNVNTSITAVANTGDNEQEMEAEGTGGNQPAFNNFGCGGWGGFGDSNGTEINRASQRLTTGDAGVAVDSVVDVNDTYFDIGCNCYKNVDELKVENEETNVNTTIRAKAYTGDNEQEMETEGEDAGLERVSQKMRTGDAWSNVWSVVNVNWAWAK